MKFQFEYNSSIGTMIKVRSLMKKKPEPRQIGIQTQYIHPKFQRKSDKATDLSYIRHSLHRTHSSAKLNKSSMNSSFAHSFSGMRQLEILKKKDQEAEKKQLGTKGFKFLNLQQNTIKEVLNRYLFSKIESKKDSKVLSRQIKLSFFIRQERSCQRPSSDSLNSQTYIVDIPEISSIVVSLKDIIDKVRDIFKEKYQNEENQSQLFKKIRLTIERVVSQKSYVQVESKRGEEKAVLLRKYLQRFISDVESEKKKKKYGNKKFMYRFYHQIHSHYQKNPFYEQEQMNQVLTPCDQKENESIEGDSLKKTEIGNKLKKKATMNESFIKMRFYNNLRKQVEVLSSNTQNIMNKEMNKVSEI